MRTRYYLLLAAGAMATLSLTGCGGNKPKSDEYTKDGKLKISLRNLYFDDYQGGDSYLEELENEFGVKLNFEAYSWAQWEQQVSGQVNGGNLPDVFHANIDSYNFALTYKFWAEENIIKPLPEDLSKWPNIKTMLDNTSNIDALKINGKIYGLPIAKNTTDYSTSFSPFTYIYRRDWAKKYGVYQENDEYTWEQFENLLKAFKKELPEGKYALGDVEWGFPSIVNFYKQVPHCFAYDEEQDLYVNNYTTEAYINGLEESKRFKKAGYYYPAQNEAADGAINKMYYGNKIGVFYENLSYQNYNTLRKQLITSNWSDASFNVDDATAIMRIKGTDDKYALEGTDNWFSMTFFDKRISNKKQEKLLDVLNWLLSDEGTKFSVYGIEGYDYTVDDKGEIHLVEAYWPKDPTTGQYARKDNGGRYLRYLVSLGYDTLSYDPLTDKTAINYLEAWEADMKTALGKSELKVLKENKEVMWLTTPQKSQLSGGMRSNALKNVMKYIYGEIGSISDYKSKFGYPWPDVLNEINKALGKK